MSVFRFCGLDSWENDVKTRRATRIKQTQESALASTLSLTATGAEQCLPPSVDWTNRERSLPARLLMGSVTDHLVQISPKPVLVIR